MLGVQITVTAMPTVSTLEAVSSVSAEQATRGMEESVQVIIIIITINSVIFFHSA